jgi:hypothetical protein
MAVYTPNIISVISGSQVEVRSNTNVQGILNSQSGNVLIVHQVEITAQDNAQLLEPLNYQQMDAFGNSETSVVPMVVDPYQSETVINGKIGKPFIFDATNSLGYAINANQNVRMLFYVEQYRNGDLLTEQLTNNNVDMTWQDIITNLDSFAKTNLFLLTPKKDYLTLKKGETYRAEIKKDEKGSNYVSVGKDYNIGFKGKDAEFALTSVPMNFSVSGMVTKPAEKENKICPICILIGILAVAGAGYLVYRYRK